MFIQKCGTCGAKLCKNGKTTSGKTRWRCLACGASKTSKIDNRAKVLKRFTDWLLGRITHREMPGEGRTFRRETAWCWQLWPTSPYIDEIHPVVFIDAIHLGRKAAILIACTKDHTIGWTLAKTESSTAYARLLSKIAPPLMVVSDGGSGFAKALREQWPEVPHQRCVFHVASQIKRLTTRQPKTEAGKMLLQLADILLAVKSEEEQVEWTTQYTAWCSRFKNFLAEKSLHQNGRLEFTHQRLRKARSSLDKLIREGTLFTFLTPELERMGAPRTNNRIEGGVNARLREMLRRHKGLSLDRQIKAIMWWCWDDLEYKPSWPQMVENTPRDDMIVEFYRHPRNRGRSLPGAPGYGEAVVWHELHNSDPYRLDWD